VKTLNIATALPLLADSTRDWDHHWWPLWPLLWALLIGTVVWLIVRRRGRHHGPLDRAQEVLAERFARGEISGEEYRARLDELKRPSA
jgi:putative membrane protein